MVRVTNRNSVQYSPGVVPNDPAQLPRYLQDEFAKIASAVLMLAAGHLDVSTVAPAKPREGDLRIANGTSWDPGSGAGLYRHNGTAWVHVG